MGKNVILDLYGGNKKSHKLVLVVTKRPSRTLRDVSITGAFVQSISCIYSLWATYEEINSYLKSPNTLYVIYIPYVKGVQGFNMRSKALFVYNKEDRLLRLRYRKFDVGSVISCSVFASYYIRVGNNQEYFNKVLNKFGGFPVDLMKVLDFIEEAKYVKSLSIKTEVPYIKDEDNFPSLVELSLVYKIMSDSVLKGDIN